MSEHCYISMISITQGSCDPVLTEEQVSLLVVEAEDRQRLSAGFELPVGHVVSGMDQFDHTSLPTSCKNAAVLSGGFVSSEHQHRGPGQREELLQTHTADRTGLISRFF